MKELKKVLRSIVAIVLIFSVLSMTAGCYYFKVSSYTPPESKTQAGAIDPSDYIIVHSDSSTFHLNKLVIDQSKNEIRGFTATIDKKHNNFPNPQPDANRYLVDKQLPTNEVHIYVDAVQINPDGSVIIPMSKIRKLDVYDKDVANTTASFLLSAIGIGAAAFLTFMLVALLFKSSCPFIYIESNGNYIFYGEIYGGAIARNLERDDYMPLPLFEANNGLYNLKITNELQERQYTDVAELLYVVHDRDLQVLMDDQGQLYSFRDPELPISARSETGLDHLPLVAKHDSLAYPFMDENAANPDFSAIELVFPRDANADTAKLILNLKNTLWLDYIMGSFYAQFGDKYEEFVAGQQNKPAEEKIQWAKEQGIMLSVKIKTQNGWETIKHINMVGPLASRSFVVPVDLSRHTGEQVEIRLESGFHFWELDYAAMDFSMNETLQVQNLALMDAKDENGVDLTSDLIQQDGNYLEQHYVGAQAFLSYKAEQLSAPNKTASLFLHTSGYYEYIRNYTGKPNVAELKEFKNPGAFAHFSKSKFLEMAGTN